VRSRPKRQSAVVTSLSTPVAGWREQLDNAPAGAQRAFDRLDAALANFLQEIKLAA